MGTIASVFQGTLFGVMNAAILAYLGYKLDEEFGIPVGILPRIVIFHFCMCFVLGLVFVESISLRIDPVHGAVVGPMGTFLATLIGLYVTSIAVLLTHEFVILAPTVFAVAFAYGQAKAINFHYTKFGPFIAAIVFMFGLIVLLIDSDYVDDFAKQIGTYFDLGESIVPKSYLMEPGGVFSIPLFAPVFITITAYGLMWSQIPPPPFQPMMATI